MKLTQSARLALALILAGLLPACQSNPGGAFRPAARAADVRHFQVRGVVKQVNPEGRTVVIAHETIPGYMPAMTMPFDVKDPRELSGVNPGDKVGFRMVVTAEEGWIDQVKVIEPGAVDASKPVIESVRIARIVDELKEGDRMPDYRFTNELRQAVSLSQFKGQALGITFIYTRCPYPNFCPRMNSNFAQAATQLTQLHKGPKNWHLLSISFDPEHDTPATLKAYARKLGYDRTRWSFLTGPMIDIDAITEQFGMFFARDGQGFSHNVRTVVVDASGTIQRIIVGNEWKVEDLVSEMVKAGGAQRH